MDNLSESQELLYEQQAEPTGLGPLAGLNGLAWSQESGWGAVLDYPPTEGSPVVQKQSWSSAVGSAGVLVFLAVTASVAIVTLGFARQSAVVSDAPPVFSQPTTQETTPSEEPPRAFAMPTIAAVPQHMLIGDDWFISILTTYGWVFPDGEPDAIRRAHTTCDWLADHTISQTETQVMVNNRARGQIDVPANVAEWVQAAAKVYCPEYAAQP